MFNYLYTNGNSFSKVFSFANIKVRFSSHHNGLFAQFPRDPPYVEIKKKLVLDFRNYNFLFFYDLVSSFNILRYLTR